MRFERNTLIQIAQESKDIIKSGVYTDEIGNKYNVMNDIQNMHLSTSYYIKEKQDIVIEDIDAVGHIINIKVVGTDTLSACCEMAKSYGSACALNFASAKNPGGGFDRGAMAQEEALCFGSTLYGSLLDSATVYNYSRNHLNNSLYATWSIYSPSVVIYRDTNTMRKHEPVISSFITSPAPNKKAFVGKASVVREAMRERCEFILKTAIINGERNLVLGAFGCGVFGNSALEVATIWYNLLYKQNYSKYFDNVYFAILDVNSENYKVFSSVFKNSN
jgi:uncharacterized protein (TIGR02452 family)